MEPKLQSDIQDILALSSIPGIGNLTLRNLISYAGSAKIALSLSKAKLEKIPGIGSVTSQALFAGKAQAQLYADEVINKCIKKKVDIITLLSDEYPSRLKQIPDAPAILFTLGAVATLPPRIIAIVGTRNSTAYGKEVTEKIISGLVPLSPVIVSGLAYGIDSHAHRFSIEYGLPTYAVMATGPDKIYPAQNRELASKILSSGGGILTEYPPETKMDPNYFPARNRIIAGLADATIVVEAAESGGALITARLAFDYNRDVFAVPNSIFEKQSGGCNQLIQSNIAKVFTTVEDLCKELNYSTDPNAISTKASERSLNLENLSEQERTVVAVLLAAKDLHIDEVAWRTQITMGQLASVLLNLEFAGIVKNMPGKRFKLAK